MKSGYLQLVADLCFILIFWADYLRFTNLLADMKRVSGYNHCIKRTAHLFLHFFPFCNMMEAISLKLAKQSWFPGLVSSEE